MALAVDISNFNAWTPTIAQQYKAAGIEHVIVRLGLGFEHTGLIETAQRQLQIALDAGLGVSGYVWAYFNSTDPAATAQEAVSRYDGYDLHTYWVDCEADALPTAPQNIDWLSRCLATFDSLGQRTGVYTGRWWWVQGSTMNNYPGFRNRPLWAATDDQVPDLQTAALFGGWDHLTVEQYDLHGVDDDVIDDEYLRGKAVTQPTDAERLSYLGGLTHDIIPQIIAELEAAHGKTKADQAAIDRALTALRAHAG